MTTTVKLARMLHRKSAEYCTANPAGNTAAGSFFVSDKSNVIPTHDIAYYVGGVSAIWNYNPDTDAYLQLPNSGIAGAFAAGSCGEFRALSAPAGQITNTATAGTTTTLTTALDIKRDAVGYSVLVVGGTGIGYQGTITGNTLGANAVLTVTPANGVAFDNTTQFRICGGSLWFFNAGTSAVGFAVYDRLTNMWTQRSVTGLPTAWGTDGQLVSTGSCLSNNGNGFVNSTATSATGTTLVDSTKTWPSGGWINAQVRIISGTGKGQIRTITANNTTTLTVATWTVTPDATSVYRIEGNDDYMYLLGNNAVAMYRYSVSGNSWSTLSPVAARAAAPGAGLTADWIDSVADALWSNGVYANHYTTALLHQNGRYIYSFRGAGGNVLDVYDIAANTWISGIAYGQQTETFGAGSCSVDIDGFIYIQKDATGRIYTFDVAKNVLEPFVYNPVPQGAAVAGDKMILTTYSDGAKINFLYTLGNTRAELTRWMII